MESTIRNAIKGFLKIKLDINPVYFSVLERSPGDGYERLLISYQSHDDDFIPAYLLLPEGEGPFPAVIVHHQHNGERHLGKSEVCGLIGDPYQAFGPALAKQGFVVLAPDSICFEDRRKNCKGTKVDEANDWMQHYNEMCYRIIQGDTLMRKVLEDASIGVSLLYHHPMVDKSRIGTLGHSYGGNTVNFLSALDERIQYSCSSGAASAFRARMDRDVGIEMASVIPGFMQQFDLEDLFLSIAPRKILVLSADEDKYSKDADEIENKIKNMLKNQDISWLQHKRFSGKHALTEERFSYILDWMVKNSRQD